ncbi:outer membrane protein [Piscirickettsia salmonis]|uniref:outer membrane protein n=1 Tax=Piscirickettsia salmonis TaxID=1238 RepID=UPI0007C928C5|nr:OmpA-like transmembrane domain protein [Piscirickettsiaceae bacterium NZ-RLO1]
MKALIKLTAITALLISASALAAKPGAYIGLNLGYGGMDTPSVNFKNKYPDTYSYSQSSRGFAGRINAGYLWSQDSLNYGIELGYATYANSKYSMTNKDGTMTLKYSGNSLDLLGVIQYNFTPNWNVFGKAGLAYVTQKTSGSNAFKAVFKNNNKVLPEVALGAGYEFANGIGLNVTASHIFGNQPAIDCKAEEIKNDINQVASVDMVTIGISYNF